MTLTELTDTIINAVATRLDMAGIAYWAGFDGDTSTHPGPVIYAKRLQPDHEEAIAINVYSLTMSIEPGLNAITALVQVRYRAPFTADTLADQAMTALHGHHHETWGDLTIHRCRLLSIGQLGLDPETGLDERTDNYELHLN